jgi:hypothetical protein
MPTTICTAVSNRFTATLTQVLRAAAAARSAAVCSVSSWSCRGEISMGQWQSEQNMTMRASVPQSTIVPMISSSKACHGLH